jgi:CRISPR-associated protein Cas5 subtype I-B
MNGLDKQHEETLQLKELLNIGDILSRDYNKTKRLVKKIDFDLVQTVLESLKFEKSCRLLELLKILESNKENDSDSNKELDVILDELKSELQYPEYYRKLKHIKIGIKPSVRRNFPFNKTMNKYNSRNSYFSNADENIPISEQLLIKPEYRIYAYENDVKILDELAERIKNNNPIFMPYLGKNEFIANFGNLEIIDDVNPMTNNHDDISSIFLRNENNEDRHHIKADKMRRPRRGGSVVVTGLPQGFKFLEHYPIGYSEEMHYNLQVAEFTARSDEFSTIDLEKGMLLKINNEIIYLF